MDPVEIFWGHHISNFEKKIREIHALFFIRILFIRIIRLRSGKNKNNLRIIKAQILPKDEVKSKENRA